MQVRVDKRIPPRLLDNFHGIDYVTKYSYLGVVISDDLNF